MARTIDLIGWNVKQGGYDRHHIFDTDTTDLTPEREATIQAFIDEQHEGGVDAIALTDTYGWHERYGDDTGIAQHLGFNAARFTPLHDERIDRILGPGAGITFATDHTIEHSSAVDIGNRQAQKTILDLGGHTLQIATIYPDDMDENLRLQQFRALLDSLEAEPTVIVGDFTTLRPDMKDASANTKAHDLGVRALAFSFGFIPDKNKVRPLLEAIGKGRFAAKVDYYRRSIRSLNERRVIPELKERGWQDADSEKRPTMRKGGLAVGVDYILTSPEITTHDFQVIPTNSVSDHNATRVRVDIQSQTKH